jgi:hypothetical protein
MAEASLPIVSPSVVAEFKATLVPSRSPGQGDDAAEESALAARRPMTSRPQRGEFRFRVAAVLRRAFAEARRLPETNRTETGATGGDVEHPA